MVKSKTSVERQINDRLHQYIAPSESSLAECLMIIDDIRKYIVERIEEAEKRAKENEPQQEEKAD